MQTWSVTEFKAQVLGILEQVVQTGEPVIVTKRGKAIAKVIPLPYGTDVSEDVTVQEPGKLKGTVLEEVDIVSPLGADIWDAARDQVTNCVVKN
ncbi:MAG: type II toxin-antitoxin system Phd/YefM family antitoxin [Gemmatimonadetes bacterium]|nr:type II toxin-antitoxin system Phd/YefM family antitoxin [Gemmatimonadota bacterium]